VLRPGLDHAASSFLPVPKRFLNATAALPVKLPPDEPLSSGAYPTMPSNVLVLPSTTETSRPCPPPAE
jgi:hypothetical protein